MCWTMKAVAHGGSGHSRLSSAKAPAGQTSICLKSAGGQRAPLSGTATAQASADPSGEQIQTLDWPMTRTDRYRYSGCHRRHEGKIVRQFEQVGNCGGESNIAIKRNAVFSTPA